MTSLARRFQGTDVQLCVYTFFKGYNIELNSPHTINCEGIKAAKKLQDRLKIALSGVTYNYKYGCRINDSIEVPLTFIVSSFVYSIPPSILFWPSGCSSHAL